MLLLGLISISLTGCLPGIFPDTNNPPVLATISHVTITLGETFTYPVEATDPDGDDLTYSLLTGNPSDMSIDENSGVISWTPTAVGSYEVTVEVSDGKLSDTESFTVTVNPALVGPSNVDLTPLTATVGVEYTGIATATPGDNTTLTFSLVGALSGMEISTAGVISWIPTATGDQLVTVVVTDGAGKSDSESFTIAVSTANHAPVITPIPDASATLGETFTYTVKATDPDEGDTLIFSLTDDSPPGMTINATTGIISWIPTTAGSFGVTVKVSDGELSDTQNFSINVIAPKRVVMAELFVAPACGRCPKAKTYMAQLLGKYGFDKLVVLEEYVANSPLPYSSGWSTWEISQRYYSGYYEYLNSGETGTPDAYFNGLNHSVHQQDSSYANYEADIEAELAKTPKVVISASYDITSSTVSISGQICNISSETLENIVIEAMVYEDSVPLVIPDNNIDTIVNHVVRDIITYQESGETITSFSPGNSYQFSLTSSYLSNVKDMSNIHVVVYVQAPNSSKMEILQALYVN